MNICFVGTLDDTPPENIHALVVSAAGDGAADRDRIRALADRFPVFLVVDDPAPARAGDDLYAAVLPLRDPMALLNVVRSHVKLRHDPMAPFVECVCSRHLPVLQASFDIKSHEAAVHCDRCGFATSIEPLDRRSSATHG
jgi:hypothetical protein